MPPFLLYPSCVRKAKQGEYNQTEYLPVSKYNIDQMYAQLLEIIKNPGSPQSVPPASAPRLQCARAIVPRRYNRFPEIWIFLSACPRHGKWPRSPAGHGLECRIGPKIFREYLPVSKYNIDQMYAQLLEIIKKTQNPYLKPLLRMAVYFYINKFH
mgnify:CR=1 FL=1